MKAKIFTLIYLRELKDFISLKAAIALNPSYGIK